MITKVYEEIKIILKQNWKSLLALFITFLIFTLELPFYIEAPGGLIDVSSRIELSNTKEINGSYNLAYVSEIRATIPMLIFSYFNPDYDILKKEEVLGHETAEEIDYRNHLLLEEAIQNATYVGFSKASEYVDITNRKVFITYIDINSKTDLKIGDQILSINDKILESKEHTYELLKDYKVGDSVNMKVLRDNKEIETSSTFMDVLGEPKIGIVMGELKDIDTNLEVDFKFKKSESGPSGGFMMALSIYNYLIEEDITHGLKIVGTGTIDVLGNVGSIGGVEYKMKAAIKEGADLFFVPSANYEEAIKAKEEDNLDINLVKVSNIDEAINYLENLNNIK